MRIVDLCAGSGMLAHAAAYALACSDPTILLIGIDPADRIHLAGNGVCPRQAAAGIVDCLDELDPAEGHWSNGFRDGIVRP